MQPSGAANSNRKGLPKTGWLVSQAETSPTCLIGIDATFAMAKGGGAEIGATKRGKGLKIMAIVDRHGLPLSVSTHAANHHESVLKVRKIPDVITKANYSHAHLRARHSHSKPPLTCLRMYSTGHHLVRGPSRIPKHGRPYVLTLPSIPPGPYGLVISFGERRTKLASSFQFRGRLTVKQGSGLCALQ